MPEDTRKGTSFSGISIVYRPSPGGVDDVKLRFRNKYVRFENWTDNVSSVTGTVGSKLNAMDSVNAATDAINNSDPFASSNPALPTSGVGEATPF